MSGMIVINPLHYNQVIRKNSNIEEKGDLFVNNDDNKKNSEDDEDNEI